MVGAPARVWAVLIACVVLASMSACTSDDLSRGCASDEWQCGNSCIARSRPCGTECDEGLVPCPESGDCRTQSECGACGPGLDRCGAECVDTMTSRDHCGSCDSGCLATQSCKLGTCTACPDPQRFVNDRQNCGSCGFVCPGDSTCENGRCKLGEIVLPDLPVTGIAVGKDKHEPFVSTPGGLQRVSSSPGAAQIQVALTANVYQNVAVSGGRLSWLVRDGIQSIAESDPLGSGTLVDEDRPQDGSCIYDPEPYSTETCAYALSAPDAFFVYWTDHQRHRIRRFSLLDKTKVSWASVQKAGAIAAAPLGEDDVHVFGDKLGSLALFRLDAAGAAVQDLVIAGHVPAAMVLDATHVYWSSWSNGGCAGAFRGIARLERNWASNSTPEQVFVAPTCNAAIHLAIDRTDASSNWLYFSGLPGGIFRIQRDGTGLEQIADKQPGYSSPLAVDGGRLYYADKPAESTRWAVYVVAAR